MPFDPMDKPIPGENMTRDTKNFAWHRPAEYDDQDKALDYISKKIFDPRNINSITVMMQQGATVVDMTQILLMSGIASGKWTLDIALMLAGPTAHMFWILAKGEDIDVELGIEDEAPKVTNGLINAVNEAKALNSRRPDPSIQPKNVQEKPETMQPFGGFAQAKPQGIASAPPGMVENMETGGVADEGPMPEEMQPEGVM